MIPCSVGVCYKLSSPPDSGSGSGLPPLLLSNIESLLLFSSTEAHRLIVCLHCSAKLDRVVHSRSHAAKGKSYGCLELVLSFF